MKRYVESFVKPVRTASPDESLASVARTMEQHNVGAVVALQTPVARVMTSPVETVGCGDGVFHATQIMRERNVRRLAVVDDDGELAGIVTFDDLLRLLSRELSNLVEGIAPEMQVR
jgi:CBS domain-containing protein